MQASIRFVVPGIAKPRAYADEPPPGEPEISAGFEARKVTIRNLRPLAARLSAEHEGFQLIDAPTAVRDFDDEGVVRSVYYREIEQLVARATGAARVIVFDHTIRRRRPGAVRGPVYNAHVDFTATSGLRRALELPGGDPAGPTIRRHSIINAWRPIVGPLRDAPLALADAQTVAATDLVAADLVYPERTGEYYLLKYSPAQRWYYVPAMQPCEVLLLKNYDSAVDGRARFSPHGAFDDPGMPPDAPPRASIELRMLVCF